MRSSHPRPIYGGAWSRAKACAAASFAAALALLGPARPVGAQAVHVVRLEFDTDDGIGRFVPARVTVRPGDVVRFRVVSGAPHSVSFEAAGLSAAARDLLNAALPGRTADLTSPVLGWNGMEYRLVVPALPPGHYDFFCIPHRAYDMRGELIVVR